MTAISRSDGHSATAAAAYRAGELLKDERTGEKHDYRKRKGIESVTLHMPPGAPAMQRSDLWNKAEGAENRKNSTVARECEVSLPFELDLKTKTKLANEFAQWLADRHGCAVDAAVHTPTEKNDERNTHAHLLMTTRRVKNDGSMGEKCRELDVLKTGSIEVSAWREHWANICNRELDLAGFSERIDHRSFKDQGIEKIPTVHVGHGSGAAQRAALNEEITAINNELAAALKERAALAAEEAIEAATTAASADVAQALDREEKTAQTPVKETANTDIAAAPLTPNEITALRQELAAPTPTRAELTQELAEAEKTVIAARKILPNCKSTSDIAAAKKALPAATDDVESSAKTLARIEQSLIDVPWYRPFKKWSLENALPEAQAAARAAREHEQETRIMATAIDRAATYAAQVAAQARAAELKTALEALPAAAEPAQHKRDAISNILLSDAAKKAANANAEKPP